eukprot:EG_transcript_15737
MPWWLPLWLCATVAAPAVAGVGFVGAWAGLDALPHPRGGGSVVAVGGRLYAIGGASDLQLHPQLALTPDPDSEYWEFESRRWGPLPPMPTKRAATAAVVVGEDIYVLGGLLGQLPTSTVEIYNTTANYWRRGPPMPTPRGGASAVVYGDQIWVLGGLNQDPVDVVEIYSTKTATWAAGPALPLPRSAFAAAAWGSRVYVLGGELAYDRATFAQYINTQNMGAGWANVDFASGSQVPTQLRGFAHHTVGSTVVLMGGVSTDNIHPVNDVVAFDFDSKLLHSLPSLPKPCLYGSAATVADTLLLTGCFSGATQPLPEPDVLALRFEGAESPPPNPVPQSSSGFLGHGWLFWLGFVVLTYFAAGIFWNTQQGLEGLSILPHAALLRPLLDQASL